MTEAKPGNLSELPSGFHFHSFAYAAENLSIETDEDNKPATELRVWLVEGFPMADGEITAENEEVEVEGVDGEGKAYTEKVETTITPSAQWLNLGGSNQQTPPNVRRGERLIVLKFGDAPQLYWHCLGLDLNLRKLETVRYSISGTTSEKEDGTKEGFCYFLEMSSHGQYIMLENSAKNGEKAVFTVQLNLKEGAMFIADEKGNEFEFDSVETILRMLNANKTLVELNKKKILMKALDSIEMEAGNEIKMKTKHVLIDAPDTDVSGNVKIAKDLGVTGTATIGNLVVTGTSKMTGTISGGTIEADTVKASTSVTAPNLKYT